MADYFLAEIRIFPFNFAPTGWAMCDGQLLPILQNTTLFSFVGTYYGGDGKSNFALPNMQGRIPMHAGQGPGLSLHALGQTGGVEMVKLSETEIPSHTHVVRVAVEPGELSTPAGNSIALSTGANAYAAGTPSVNMNENQINTSGGDRAHNNLQPYLTSNFCIAIQGEFPNRY